MTANLVLAEPWMSGLHEVMCRDFARSSLIILGAGLATSCEFSVLGAAVVATMCSSE